MLTTAVPSPTSSSSSSSGSTSTVPVQTLGQNDFLKLLMAQLANQDPTAPVDDQQFAAQLAQFSSLQQLQDIGTKLDTLSSNQAAANQMQTTSLVGKNVLYSIPSGLVPFDGTTAVSLDVNLSGAASSVNAAVTDASGNVVRVLTLGAEPAGMSAFSWDGKDTNGNPLPAGSYGIAVSALGANGQAVTGSVYAQGTVTGVAFSSSGSSAPVLIVGNQQVSLSNVVQVVNPGA